MFRRLKKSIAENKRFVEEIKLYDSAKLFSMRDASARCVCDMLVDCRLHGALSLLSQYVVLSREIDRRCKEA